MLWVAIKSSPVVQLSADSSVIEFTDQKSPVSKCLLSVSSLISSSIGEGANLTVTLNNKDGMASFLFAAHHPIGEALEVYRGPRLVFSGVVKRVRLSEQNCVLDVEA